MTEGKNLTVTVGVTCTSENVLYDIPLDHIYVRGGLTEGAQTLSNVSGLRVSTTATAAEAVKAITQATGLKHIALAVASGALVLEEHECVYGAHTVYKGFGSTRIVYDGPRLAFNVPAGINADEILMHDMAYAFQSVKYFKRTLEIAFGYPAHQIKVAVDGKEAKDGELLYTLLPQRSLFECTVDYGPDPKTAHTIKVINDGKMLAFEALSTDYDLMATFKKAHPEVAKRLTGTARLLWHTFEVSSPPVSTTMTYLLFSKKKPDLCLCIG
ncbi:Hypothetical protein POVN_LOCUS497 [uncultured virus]|nr:Hypothetical protein POVN_LOCUS497 [uncultured virus]